MKFSRGKGLLLLGVVLVFLDQLIKVLVKINMPLGGHFSVIGTWFQIFFVENEGMAFGMKFGGMIGKLVLSVFRLVLFGVLCWWIAKLDSRKGDRRVPTGVLVGITMITAGALGNIFDCVLYGQLFSASTYSEVASFGGSYAPVLFGKVVDMFYFPIIDSTWPEWVPFIGGDSFRFFAPVFNFADSCVTVGAAYLILFHYRYISSDESGLFE